MDSSKPDIRGSPPESTALYSPSRTDYASPLRLTRQLVKAILGDGDTPGCSSTWRFRVDRDFLAPADNSAAGSKAPISWLQSRGSEEAQSTEAITAWFEQLIRNELFKVRYEEISRRRSSFGEESLPIYFDNGDQRPSPTQTGFSVVLVPVGIDTSALQRIREGRWPPTQSRVRILESLQLPRYINDATGQDPMMEELRDGATALRRILEFRERTTKRENAMTLNARGKRSSPLLLRYPADVNGSLRAAIQYFEVVYDVQRYNCTGAIRHIVIPHSDHEQIRVDIEHNMHLRWQNALRTEYRKERRALRERKRDVYYLDDEQERSRVDTEKRLLNKQIFDECKLRELSEAAAGLREQMEQPLSELAKLFTYYLAQRSDMMTRSTTLPELVEDLDDKLTSLTDTIDSSWRDLEEQIDTLDTILTHANTVTRKAVTQLHRLTALDVPNPDARAEEVSKRLEHPEALHFIGRVVGNMQTIHNVALSVAERAHKLAAGAQGVAAGGLKVMVAAEDCVVYAEVEGCSG
ncbi:hypothetical protein W97_01606 [Coniosporium apollinis CBS 100218]|uniref:Uncharacterized protein n=1 Tax=Coniosporium apollinis (strain CBS 100218) TaxID=1168221 RepID=R7YKP2_CONA1|nr:uncharacterized protein W97_01606 [Coniosporium apollinis CBS 100218]EON62384.1 hypothetical protein W97_01606 [Coniosporium apollinis CBS 100218]